MKTAAAPSPRLKGRGSDKGWRPEAPPLQGRGLGWGLSVAQIDWLQNRAAEMRRSPTEPEKRLWRYLSNSQLDGLKFRRQEVIGRYIADFMRPVRSLIVEVDGDTHGEARDRQRDDVLEQLGFLVLRVSNDKVMRNAEGVLTAINLAAAGRSSRHSPHPNPSPEGEWLIRAQKPMGIPFHRSMTPVDVVDLYIEARR